METNNGTSALYAPTRQKWRHWLENHSRFEKAVCLILYHKKSKTQSVNYNDAIEEALCFGWIDSKANKRDEESYYLRFTPRKPDSNWSQPNIERVERMIDRGMMTEAGQRLIDTAKQKEKWRATAKA